MEVKKGQDIYAGLFITLHFTTGQILKFLNDVVHNNFISRGIQRGIGNAIILLYIIFQVRKNICPIFCLILTMQTTKLDTNTLEYELVPLDLKDNVVVIMNTNKRRELADSKYNERRAECEKAVEELKQKLSIATLGELNEWDFDEYSYLIHCFLCCSTMF